MSGNWTQAESTIYDNLNQNLRLWLPILAAPSSSTIAHIPSLQVWSGPTCVCYFTACSDFQVWVIKILNHELRTGPQQCQNPNRYGQIYTWNQHRKPQAMRRPMLAHSALLYLQGQKLQAVI